MLDQRQGKLRIADTALRVEIDTSLAVATTKKIRATVLLDRTGSVTGVDLREDGFQGLVVMIGTHESVARSEQVDAVVHFDANGEPAFVELPRRFSHLSKTLI